MASQNESCNQNCFVIINIHEYFLNNSEVFLISKDVPRDVYYRFNQLTHRFAGYQSEF